MTSASFHPQSGPLRPAQKDSVLSFKKTYPGPALAKLLLGQTDALQKLLILGFPYNFTFTTGLPAEDRNYKVGNGTWNMELS